MDKQEENWKNIEGFEGLYDISDKGRVYSYYSNKILSGGKNKKGYYFVNLCKNGKEFNKRIHSLVAEHFIPNLEGYPEINHKNEIKTDNRVENLEWVSHQYNSEFSIAGYYVLYDPSDEPIEIYNLNKFARDNGLDNQPLCAVAKGKIKSHKGYTKQPNTKLKRMGSFRLISPEGEVVTFQKQTEAAECIGTVNASISDLLKGKLKSCKGWRLHPLEGIFAFT